jgi:excisionase family DNA binding protein
MREAARALGVSRQTVLQRVKHGELEAVHVMRGKQKGLRIKVLSWTLSKNAQPQRLGWM